ncbi:MAG: hypothetical protein R3F49_05930 [Planctomycetota bacterium]
MLRRALGVVVVLAGLRALPAPPRLDLETTAPTRPPLALEAGAQEAEVDPAYALAEAHAARARGALDVAITRYSGVASDPRSSATLRELASYWAARVRLEGGEPHAVATLLDLARHAFAPDIALRSASAVITHARESATRRRAFEVVSYALRLRVAEATEDGARWSRALARLAERVDVDEDFFREKAENVLHSALDSP